MMSECIAVGGHWVNENSDVIDHGTMGLKSDHLVLNNAVRSNNTHIKTMHITLIQYNWLKQSCTNVYIIFLIYFCIMSSLIKTNIFGLLQAYISL